VNYRSNRVVEAGQEDKIVDDCDLITTLLHLLPHLLPTVNTSMAPAKVAEKNRKVNETDDVVDIWHHCVWIIRTQYFPFILALIYGSRHTQLGPLGGS
jgi:hypothetical protein